MKKYKNKLFFTCFILISALSVIYLILLSNNVDKITDYNFYSEGSSPSKEIQNSVLVYIYPALAVYIASCIFFLIKKAKPRKILYPIAVITFVIFVNYIGQFKSGGSWGWSVFFTFLPTIWIIAMSIEFGMKLDKKYEEK